VSPCDLQERWRRSESLHIDGVVFASGRVILFDVKELRAADGTVTCVAAPFAETSAESVLHYNSDAWVEVTSTSRVDAGNARRVLAGEGAMGNEGFIALERDETLEWVFFCTQSNPFSDLRVEGDIAYATDGYGNDWQIPLASPQELKVTAR